MKLRQYKSKGKFLVLVGTKKGGGSLNTVKELEGGKSSYAHLFPDGSILRYGKKIGDVKDLRFVKWVTVEADFLGGILDMLKRMA